MRIEGEGSSGRLFWAGGLGGAALLTAIGWGTAAPAAPQPLTGRLAAGVERSSPRPGPSAQQRHAGLRLRFLVGERLRYRWTGTEELTGPDDSAVVRRVSVRYSGSLTRCTYQADADGAWVGWRFATTDHVMRQGSQRVETPADLLAGLSREVLVRLDRRGRMRTLVLPRDLAPGVAQALRSMILRQQFRLPPERESTRWSADDEACGGLEGLRAQYRLASSSCEGVQIHKRIPLDGPAGGPSRQRFGLVGQLTFDLASGQVRQQSLRWRREVEQGGKALSHQISETLSLVARQRAFRGTATGIARLTALREALTAPRPAAEPAPATGPAGSADGSAAPASQSGVSPDSRVQRQIERLAAGTRPEDEQALIRLAADRDLSLISRQRALLALGRSPVASEAAWTFLRGQLAVGADDPLRSCAWLAIARQGRTLQRRGERVRTAALAALLRTRWSGAADLAEKRRTLQVVRSAALPASLDLLAQALAEPEAGLRLLAVSALRDLPGRGARRLLAQALQDPSAAVRELAARVRVLQARR